jgi:hypothetical protein
MSNLLKQIVSVGVKGGATIINALFSNSNNRDFIYRALNELRNSTKNLHEPLVPIDEGELKYLSFSHVPQKRFAKNKINILTSIYNEPFLAYYTKDIKSDGDKILVAYTADTEYSYVLHKGKIDVFVNENPFAIILDNGHIKNMKNETVGKIEQSKSNKYKRLNLHNKNVAEFREPDQMTLPERIYTYLDTSSKNDETLVLAITIPDLLMR